MKTSGTGTFVVLAVLLCSVLLVWPVSGDVREAPFEPDEHTLLLLHFDEAKGEPGDAGAHGNPAVLQKASRTREGRFGSAVVLNGADAYVEIQRSASLEPARTVTVEAWVWRDPKVKPRPGNAQVIVAKKGQEPWSYALRLNARGDDDVTAAFRVITDRDRANLYGRTRLETGKWYHLAGVFNGEKARIFVNGKEEAVSSRIEGSLDYEPEEKVYIGYNYGFESHEYFGGKIDEVRISNIARYGPRPVLRPIEAVVPLAAIRGQPLGLIASPRPAGTSPFRTSAPEGPADGRFSFVVFGDNRSEEPIIQPKVFRHIIREVNLLHPDFAIDLGDFIRGYTDDETHIRREWDEFRKVTGELTVPLYMAAGNHDIWDEKSHAIYQELFGKDSIYFSFDYGTAHFVFLCTDIPGQVSRITGAQYDWLAKDLEAARAQERIFVFLHKPLFTKAPSPHVSLADYPEERDRLRDLLVEHGVDIVFAGHMHYYDQETRDGIVHITTGGAGSNFLEVPGTGDFYHYLVVTVDGKDVHIAIVKPGSVLPAMGWKETAAALKK